MATKPLRFNMYYHIYNRGNNGENLFVKRQNYQYFLELYAKYVDPVAETYAFCLLPNHFHFAIRTYTEEEQEAYFRTKIGPISVDESGNVGIPQTGPIFKLQAPSRAFNNWFIAYARAFNRTTNRTGALFSRPFRRKIVDDPAYLQTLICYIHRNPQKHGLIRDFRDWLWSSYSAILSDKPTRIRREVVLKWYEGRSRFVETQAFEQHESTIMPLLLEDWF